MRNSLKVILTGALIALGLAACSGDDIDECHADVFCERDADGRPACVDGYVWEDPNSDTNLTCVPFEDATNPGGTTPGTGDNNDNQGGDTGGTGDDGCPPNSHREGDSCYCDEGFVVNDAQTACVEGDSSSNPCPPNSHLQGDSCYCDEGYTVNEEQTACVAECETDSDCTNGQICENNSCREPRCTPGSCPEGTVCEEDSGYCIQDIGTLPPEPNLNCDVLPAESCAATDTSCIPDWQCSGSDCGNLISFNPRTGNHYWDYPLNGELEADQYRSFIRGDVRNLVRYASAWVRCMSADRWDFGNGAELALGDMSEANGDIPGTRDGQPGHPSGTHVNGHDMDIGYYQTQYSDNRLRSICEHTSNGQDQYHCTSSPNNLDVWRTALVLAKMHDNPNLRVIGVDGQAGLLVESAISQMCSAGWINGNACRSLRLAWEVTDEGRGWYRFHHHHFHISISGNKSAESWDENVCLQPGCGADARIADPRMMLYPELRMPLYE